MKELSPKSSALKNPFARRVLIAPVLSLIISSGCGNAEEITPKITPEPTPISTPIPSPMPTEIPTFTPLPKPSEVPPTPTSTLTPTRTPMPGPAEPTPTTTSSPIPTSTATQIPTRVPTPEPTATPTPEAKAEPINFMFGEGVTLEQQKEIRDGIIMAKKWFFAKTGIEINNVSVFAFANSTQLVDQYLARDIYPRPRDEAQKQLADATAFIGEQRDMFINTSSPGWTNSSPIIGGPVAEGRKHTLAHEWLHIFQREVGGYNGSFPHWLNEGGAHYAAARTLVNNNVYPYEKIRDGHLKEAGNMRESLKLMESPQGFYGAGSPFADEYSLGFLAVEYLVKDLPNEGIPAIARFWQEIGKGNPWQTAFQTSFGKTPDQFYTEFEKYRQQGFR